MATRRSVKPQGNEWNALTVDSAVADATGRRHGRIRVVIRKPTRDETGMFRVLWLDNGEETIVTGAEILSRYTTQSAKYNGVDTPRANA